MHTTIDFNGSIPQHYEDYLTNFLFDPFAEDIVQRAVLPEGSNILELAAGTGCVTRHLLNRMPARAHLTATDLQKGMLEVAKRHTDAANVSWATADMTDIPYGDDQFDLVVCQFAIMLVPEKLKALREMHRVLKPGGQLLFNVWGNLQQNDVWNIGSNVIGQYVQNNPVLQDPGPFSLNEQHTQLLLKESGFSLVKSTVVDRTGVIPSAAMAAKGFIEGLPVVLAISKSNPELIPQIEQSLEHELVRRLGNDPLRSPLQALVFEAYK